MNTLSILMLKAGFNVQGLNKNNFKDFILKIKFEFHVIDLVI